MGVPKFFRWISERYPCLSVSVTNNQIPDFDCLYLDMNGIIHICSHPDDTNVHFRITEADIFSNIFNYVEFLFKTVKPKDVFFLAVDGVAPRAKMNQQRARRLKSAKEALNREESAIQSGTKLPDEKRFDSNAITPGTEFMNRLHTALKAFLDEKIKSDSLWQGVDIILSGHETPGEGEHKIQEFIRYRRSLPTYNPNTRHCLYGLDADLMLLGLASHEPYFSLLREDVSFSKKKTKRAYIAEESKFFLLHLSLLREYIDYEFSDLKTVLEDEYNLERIIDDWIVLSFLVGNDFVPHLPNLHIHTSALPLLWETYIRNRPLLNGYINDAGKLNVDNLLQYVGALSKFDEDIFLEKYEDMQWLLGKTGERLNKELENLDNIDKRPELNSSCNIIDEIPDEISSNNLESSLANFFSEPDIEHSEPSMIDDSTVINDSLEASNNIDDILSGDELKETIVIHPEEIVHDSVHNDRYDLSKPMGDLQIDKDLIEFDFSVDENVSNGIVHVESNLDDCNDFQIPSFIEGGDDKEIWELQYRCYKRDYYYSKMGLTSSDDMLIELARQYVSALQWISFYYFSGVPSWDWFYPQHYAPFVSDLCYLSADIRSTGITFDIGQPFLPFEQMMAVLPADSSELLPSCFRPLMIDEQSPIIDFYPKTFKSDLNGKKKDWEAVVLIPFIDEKRLLESLEPKKLLLSQSEIQRNVHGPHIKYRYLSGEVTVSDINPDVFRIAQTSILTGLCPNVRTDVICQGFPTFQHIDHTFILEKVGVKIFEFSANSSSILLKISPPKESPIPIENVARKFINKIAYVNWPAFFEAKVVAVLDETRKLTINPKTKEIISEPLSDRDTEKMIEFKKLTPRNLFKRSAISIDETNFIILETYHSIGKTYEISGTHKAGSTIQLTHNWCSNRTFWHLHQLAVLKESIQTFESNPRKICTKLGQLFPPKAIVFSLDTTHYGRSGRVVSIINSNSSIEVQLDSLREPIFPKIDLQNIHNEYMTAAKATEYFDISAILFSRITGTLYINITYSTNRTDQKPKKSDKNRNHLAIGLDLKNNKQDLQIPGWVVKGRSNSAPNRWLYSIKVVEVLKEYREKFPEIFDFIQKPDFETLAFEEIYDKEVLQQKATELTDFLNNLPYKSLERIDNNSKIICESNIQLLEKSVDNVHLEAVMKNSERVTHAFHDVYRPHHSLHGVQPDKSTVFELLDRVICSTDGYTVPLGLRGVVIGIESKFNDVRLEVLFDNEFKSAISIRGSKPRCYRMPSHTLINVSYGSGQAKNKTSLKVSNETSAITHKTNRKLENCVTEVTPKLVNASSSSLEISCNPLFPMENSYNLPPMPPSEFLVDSADSPQKSNNHQINFIAHCNKIYKDEVSPKSRVIAYTANKCIPEYSQMFSICLQSGIYDPQVFERFDKSCVYISFTSSLVSLPETKEVNLVSARANMINRVWNFIFPPSNGGGPWYNDNSHYYMPEQFNNNPFLQIYPQQSKPANHNTFPVHVKTPPNKKPSTPTKIKTVANEAKNPNKPFIRCPKAKNMQFPQ